MITHGHAHLKDAHKTPQFWFIWAVLCLNVSAGIGVIAIGALPLLLTILAADLHLLADPNPNPVGFGVLFFFSVLLGSALVIAGIVRTERDN